MMRDYCVVDVFAERAFSGNPVAVVLDAEGLSTDQMQTLASWINLSETTFVVPSESAVGDYGVRIFTPVAELPFAGHPTLGTCHAWREAHPSITAGCVVQECAAGLINVRTTASGFAFAAPPLVREGAVEEGVVEHVARSLAIARKGIKDAEWVDNGPGWLAVYLDSAEAVLDIRPKAVDMAIGVVGPYPTGSPDAFEVRAFFPAGAALVEDPVTGSLNAGLAPWLLRTGRTRAPYVVSQGRALGRAGRVHVDRDEDGTIWVGGATHTFIRGQLELTDVRIARHSEDHAAAAIRPS